MINEGDNCIISYSIKNDEVYKMMTIKKNKTVKINKHEFKWDNCIGKPYGYVPIFSVSENQHISVNRLKLKGILDNSPKDVNFPKFI